MAINGSVNAAGARPSIEGCASCCVTKPKIASRLPGGEATRTYHPEADMRRRASKPGFELGSSLIITFTTSALPGQPTQLASILDGLEHQTSQQGRCTSVRPP